MPRSNVFARVRLDASREAESPRVDTDRVRQGFVVKNEIGINQTNE